MSSSYIRLGDSNFNLNSDLTREAFADRSSEMNFAIPPPHSRSEKKSRCTRLQESVSVAFSQASSILANPPLFSSTSRRRLFLKGKETIGAGLKNIYNRFDCRKKRSSFEEAHSSPELTVDGRLVPAKKQKTERKEITFKAFSSWEELPKDLLLNTLNYLGDHTVLWVCKSWQQKLLENSFSQPDDLRKIIHLRDGVLKFFRISSPDWMPKYSLSLMRDEEGRRLLSNDHNPYNKCSSVELINRDS